MLDKLPFQPSPVVLKTAALAIAVLAIIKLITVILDIYRNFKHFNAFPGEEEFSLIYGNMHLVPSKGEDRVAFGRQRMAQWPKYSRTWTGPLSPMFVFYHPDTVKLIYKSSAPKSRGLGTAYTVAHPWIGEGLISSNGHTWARSRRLLTPAFHFDVLKSYMEIFNTAADTLFEKLDVYAETGEKFDMCPLATLCTLEVILKCAMSYDVDAQRNGSHPYATASKELVDAWSERLRTIKHWPDFIYRRTAQGKRFYKNCDYVHKVAEEIIEKRKQALAAGTTKKSKRLDFLDILLNARDEDGKPMTDLEIRNEVDTFMFAGHDTTATGAPWALYNFAKYPEYQAKVQNELDSVLGERTNVEWTDLAKLPQLALCIKEAFRLFPPVPMIQRQLAEDIELDGRKVPAGTRVMVSFLNMHRNPAVWDKPDDFMPERFLQENMKDRDSFAYTPFSAGSRNCIGQNFALSEEKVVIGKILQRYHLELADDGPPVERDLGPILKATNGIWFRLKKRQI